jgi:hypothetical protein
LRDAANASPLIANLTGLLRMSLYQARDGRVSADMAAALTPTLRAFEAGKLQCKRAGKANRWEIIDP